MKRKKNILLIEDDADLCDVMTIILKKEGYDIKTIKTSKTLESLSASNLPNIIILDVLFSEEDGRKICKRLKSNEASRNIPILMYSAGNHFEEEARKAGADDFISKPFEIRVLLEKIKNLL